MANPSAFDSTGSNASGNGSLDWCYVEGVAAGKCPQAILFTKSEPPHGATVSIECVPQSGVTM